MQSQQPWHEEVVYGKVNSTGYEFVLGWFPGNRVWAKGFCLWALSGTKDMWRNWGCSLRRKRSLNRVQFQRDLGRSREKPFICFKLSQAWDKVLSPWHLLTRSSKHEQAMILERNWERTTVEPWLTSSVVSPWCPVQQSHWPELELNFMIR